jgi:hypothetical protein
MFLYRLDFVTFTTAQPTGGACTDTFEVGGSSNIAPTICGDNSGQHSKKNKQLNSIKLNCNYYFIIVYLDVQSSAISSTDLTLKFNFAAGISTYPYLPRSWNIKVAMLPCGANYLGRPITLF